MLKKWLLLSPNLRLAYLYRGRHSLHRLTALKCCLLFAGFHFLAKHDRPGRLSEPASIEVAGKAAITSNSVRQR